MVGGEPDPALSYAVMRRIRENRPAYPRWLLWSPVVASLVVFFGVAAFFTMDRTSAPPATSSSSGLSIVLESTAPQSDQGVAPAAPVTHAAVRNRRSQPVGIHVDTTSVFDSIEPEPLVVPGIELPPLENQTASVERLEIEALTIAPLTGSND